jgi:RHS repeat-associated protein
VVFRQGASAAPFVNGIELRSGGTTVKAINAGLLAGGTITINPASFTNQGTLQAQGGTLAIPLSLTVDNLDRIDSDANGTIAISGNLAGDTRQPALYTPRGTLLLNGPGTEAAPQRLEVMGRDVGLDPSGFSQNFAYGTVALAPGNWVQLVNDSQNWPTPQAEALYVNSLVVPAGTTLDLNALHVYARTAQIDGTILYGTVQLLPESGQLALNTSIPGTIDEAGQVDQWTFFGRAGRAVTVRVDPGSGAASGPIAPQLGWAAVRLLDGSGIVLAETDNDTAGSGAVVTLNRVPLPADGVYKIEVQASASHATATGNYVITVWDATPNEYALSFDQTETGRVVTPASMDHWNFSAVAGQQLQFHMVNASTGIYFELTGPGGFVGFSGLHDDSPPITLPSSGSYVVTAYGVGGQMGSYAFRLMQTLPTDLALNTPYQGTLVGSGQMQLFRVVVPSEKQLCIRLDDTSDADQNHLYAKFGSPPTRADYGYRSERLASADQQILVPLAAPGVWYILLYADWVAAPGSYELVASSVSLELTSVTPERHGTAADMLLTVTGAGFSGRSVMELVARDGATYTGATTDVVTLTQLSATFPTGSVPPGTYSVRVTDPQGGSATLPRAFWVLSGGEARFEYNMSHTSTVGQRTLSLQYVEYANTGSLAMPAPVLVLSAWQDYRHAAILTLDSAAAAAGLWTGDTMPRGTYSSIQILASGAIPGLLQPGEYVRVPVYYVGFLDSLGRELPVTFSLGAVTVDDQRRVDWDAIYDEARPEGTTEEAWNAIFQNLRENVGRTWGDYVRMLNDNAAYLGRLGHHVVDVNQLWGFELQQAYGFNQLSLMEDASDYRLATPGLKLTLQRYYSGCILGRQEVHAFGRGWFNTWSRWLRVKTDGTVIVTGDFGNQRQFQPDVRTSGTYFSPPGDGGTLTALSGGRFQLRESDGTISVFSADGRLDYVEDTNRNRITASYTDGRLTSLTHASGQWLHLAYDAAGFIESVTDSEGRVSTFTYDGDHLASATDPAGQTLAYAYQTTADPRTNHALVSADRPCGAWYYDYDAQGRLIRSTRNCGALPVTYSYDAVGTVSETDAAGATTRRYYDQNGLEAARQDPLGNFTYFTYDSAGTLARVTDAVGHQSGFTYDARGNLIQRTNPLGGTEAYTFSSDLNRLTSATDAKGNQTEYRHDAAGNLVREVYADRTMEAYAYDSVGNQVLYQNRRGQVITYAHDTQGRLTTKTYPDGSSEAYTYDGRGNLLSVSDPSGLTLMEYDSADQLTRIVYPSGRYLEYTYDAAGRRARMTGSGGYELNYNYLPCSRLESLVDGDGVTIVSYSYDSVGRLARKDLGNGTWTTYEYDLAGNLLHLVNHAPGGAVNSRFDYTYDVLGRRTSMSTLEGLWTYEYDATGQLMRVLFASNDPGTVPHHDLTYVYDAAGNRVQTLINGVTTDYVSNSMNQYDTVGTAAYRYDQDGNLISVQDGASITAYAYNADNRLIAIRSGGSLWQYEYDAFGNRVATIRDGQRTEYLLDPFGAVGTAFSWADVIGELDGSGNLIAFYNHGLGLVSQVGPPAAAHYYDFDAMGSTAGVSDEVGDYVNSHSRLPFGENLTVSEAFYNPFQYVGAWGVMTETNDLDYMRARFYDPKLGRFTTRDPIGLGGDDLNLYRYAGNNAVDRLDPTGEKLTKTKCENLVAAICMSSSFITIIQRDRDIALIVAAACESVSRMCDDFPATSDNQPPGPSPLPVPSPEPCPVPTPVPVAASRDPNQKLGPGGYGTAGFVADAQVFSYRVEFENESSAAAPAQRVEIRDQLDADLDWNTLEFTEIGFGDRIITVPSGSRYFRTTTDMNYNNLDLQVQIELAIDSQTGKVRAVFQSIDPTTYLPPDVLTGFLPPEDSTGRGMGYFSYIVKPKPDLPTGTEIRNVALIQFDFGEIIATNQIDPHDASKGIDPAKEALNTIDSGPPTSSVIPLPEVTTTLDFAVDWGGQDDAGGSGIAGYDVFFSDNGSPFAALLTSTPLTSTTFAGTNGHTYEFYTVATDHVGNRETKAEVAETTTTIGDLPTSAVVSTNRPDGSVYGEPISFSVTVTADDPRAGVPSGSVQWMIDGTAYGQPFVLTNGTSGFITTDIPAGTHDFAVRFTSDSPSFADMTSAPRSQVVSSAALTVAVDSCERVYGAANPVLTGQITGLQNNDRITASFSTSATAASHVGAYAIVPTFDDPDGNLSNYTVTVVGGTLAVRPAPLTITADNKTKVYGAAVPSLTASYTGFVNGDTPASLATPPALVTTATAGSHVGDYSITASGAASGDYTISYVGGTLSVTPAPLTITADDKSKVFWVALPALTASYSGFVNGDTAASLTTLPTLATTATEHSPVGSYDITVSGATRADYTISYVNGTLTVTTYTSGWENPVIQFDVTGDGHVAPVDVLVVINYINSHPGSAAVPAPPASAPPFYDVNGDGLVVALDVLLVINYINSRPPGQPEGEPNRDSPMTLPVGTPWRDSGAGSATAAADMLWNRFHTAQAAPGIVPLSVNEPRAVSDPSRQARPVAPADEAEMARDELDEILPVIASAVDQAWRQTASPD